jgi:hypothetical protein
MEFWTEAIKISLSVLKVLTPQVWYHFLHFIDFYKEYIT